MKRISLTKEVLQQIPKSELHLHLRGAIPIELFADLLHKYPAKEILRDASSWRRHMCLKYSNIRNFISSLHWSIDNTADLFSITNVQQFLATYGFMGCFIRDVSDLRKLIRGVIKRLKEQNVVYVEITISIIGYLKRGISLTDLQTCLEEAAEISGIRVQWIVDLVRDSGNGRTLTLLKKIIALQCESIVGITLGGSEHLFPTHHFSGVYKLARDHGLRLTIHAGEMLGSQSVWDALLILGAERIGHGVRAIEDEELVNYLVEHKIPLEVCPTSNVQLGISPSYQIHPVEKLFDAGVPITINTDDPTFFGTTLVDEYLRIHAAGVQEEKIFEMLKSGFKYAFLPEEEIKAYLKNVEQAWERLHQPDSCKACDCICV
jgi:adenosine deaminase